MLGNCLLRNPTTKQGQFDKGALCESLLFFGKVHLLIDLATLGSMCKAGFIDDLISMLKAGYLTANYSPQFPVLHTETKNGLQEHFLTVVKIEADPGRRKMRNSELLESQLARLYDEKGKARAIYKKLAPLISFDNIADNGVPQLGLKDLLDPHIARTVARMTLVSRGVPESEIRFTQLEVFPLDEMRFVVSSDIDFNRIRRFVPDEDKKTFGHKDLFASIGDARFDIGAAATQNAAFLGNERNEEITDLILRRSLGARFDGGEKAARQIYDFISVATPSIREVINSGERTAEEFITLLDKASSFQDWLRSQNPTADLVKEMLREKSQQSWFETLPVKAVRFGLFTGGGMLGDVLSPGFSVAAGAVDSFIVDRIAKHWRPHFFVENNLRGFLDRR